MWGSLLVSLPGARCAGCDSSAAGGGRGGEVRCGGSVGRRPSSRSRWRCWSGWRARRRLLRRRRHRRRTRPTASSGASRAAVNARTAQVAGLTTQLSALDDRAAAIALELSARQEQANRALVDLQDARTAADAASAAAATAKQATTAAAADVEALRARVDEFVAARYQQGLDIGPLGLLTAPGGPQEVLDRSAFADLVADQQQQVLDSLHRALVARVNADSLARKAEDDARAAAERAQQASEAAAATVANVQAKAVAQAALLAQVRAQREQVNAQLAAAIASDAGLRAQRDRFVSWQEQVAAAQRAAGAGGGGPGGRRRDRPRRRCGARGHRPGDVAAGRAVRLGRRQRPRADAGRARRRRRRRVRRLPPRRLRLLRSDDLRVRRRPGWRCRTTAATSTPPAGRCRSRARQPGDMLFFANDGVIGHVALYVGNGMMIEAPYSGAAVRLVPMRTAGLMPFVTRML